MTFGLAPIKPGTELGLLYVALVNRSHSPVTLTSVRPVGRGIGTVVKIVEVKSAPAETGNKGVPGGAYEEAPPVAWWGACGKQVLVPLRGFRLAPRALARIWIIIQGAKPGTFDARAHLVRYSQRGVAYHQLIPTGFSGSVRKNAPFIPIDKEQVRCLKSEHVRPLPGHYLHKPKNYGP